jgi:hypothetical protein
VSSEKLPKWHWIPYDTEYHIRCSVLTTPSALALISSRVCQITLWEEPGRQKEEKVVWSKIFSTCMWSSIKYSEIQTWPLRITDTHDSGSYMLTCSSSWECCRGKLSPNLLNVFALFRPRIKLCRKWRLWGKKKETWLQLLFPESNDHKEWLAEVVGDDPSS